ncbi:ABC transporter ATP-binding protein [Macrococcoides caseolyticum]|uniref:ABC transporter ATP-binding protein n=1 Tax=Macrococcus psychrotolerans TaxID=3039389 RepID=A0AAT9PAA4_9STAP|nr:MULTISPECIES: ABC transporter ATP-binding protein [Macrococcus]PKD97440.1 ABC transporter [Macrococcus caseolyticus]PKE62209.1 ABC transporter [Macrococcus caseolyticus]PKF18109.1 ABC transporter [Macrococcus caseolyticus]QYA34191.1 ABC transporter ATP-binding protein [Macrococcus sp. 19Msa1099]QYA38993.1 ABC transporter ATP-binding protein [Macrococcus caseolyticus]
MKKVIELHNVCKSFGERNIINNFSMEIYDKEFISIVGKSGCGKSTILNMIGLLESVDSGEIKIFDKKIPSVNSIAATKIRRNEINYLFQSYALISDMTIMDNLQLALEYTEKSKQQKRKLILSTLKRLGLEHLENAKVNTLSGGEQQRVAVARTIIKPGNIILADEPTGALDPKLANVSFDLIRELRDEYGKTILLVTHNMEQARLSDRIIELK